MTHPASTSPFAMLSLPLLNQMAPFPKGLHRFNPLLGQGNTAPQGFVATGAHVGIKRKRLDLALLHAPKGFTAAACFTQNTVKAAPIVWCQQILNQQEQTPHHFGALVVNSGNANACTGTQGVEDNAAIAHAVAQALGTTPQQVWVASTGVIGVPLPTATVVVGIPTAAAHLSQGPAADALAAEAIGTTDTFIKQVACQLELQGQTITLGGIAKGSGMIHPNMATMLAFITTDLALPPRLLQAALSEVTASTYNQISVDGDTSTNDMVLLMSSGTINLPQPITSEQDEAYQGFCQALLWLNTVLAQRIVQDGEGASKTLTVHVQGAHSVAQARCLSKAIIGSNLVKTALFGEQPNWGRMLSAMGATTEAFDPQQVSLTLHSEGGTLPLMQAGQPLVIDAALAATVLKAVSIEAQVNLYQGPHQATAWGCDLTPGYVAINANYLT